MPGIFISFASEDLALAQRVVAALEASGVRCWLCERDIEPAASYPAAITEAVRRSGALLLLLTGAANSSPHVAREVELAFSSRRPILPVRVGPAVPSADLQYFLSRSQWLDVGATLDDGELARIEARLRELLRGQAGRERTGVARRRWVGAAIAAAGVAAALLGAFTWTDRRATEQPVVAAAEPAREPELDGDWIAEVRKDGQPPFRIRLTFVQTGGNIAGMVRYPTGDAPILGAQLVRNSLTFHTSHTPQFESTPAIINFQAVLDADEIRFTTTDSNGIATGVARRRAADAP